MLLMDPESQEDLNVKKYGYVDLVDENGISGWFINLENLEDNKLTIKINSIEVGKIKPTFKRDDIKGKFNKDIISGFSTKWNNLDIPISLFKEKEWIIEVFHNTSKLKGNKIIKEEIIKEIKKQINLEEKTIEGHIDLIQGQYIYGWAYNPKNPKERVEVLVVIDGEIVAKGTADKYRKDLEEAGIGDGKHSFKIEIPNEYLDDKEHEIKILEKNSKLQIGNELKTKIKNIIFTIESIKDFIVSGWIILLNSTNEQKPELSLKINNHYITLRTIYYERKDLEEGFKELVPISSMYGFEFQIPGYIWDYIQNTSKKIDIGIFLNKEEIENIELTKEKIENWIDTIINNSQLENYEWQYKFLLAIEHIKYAKLLTDLSEKTKENLLKLVEVFNLWDFFKNEINVNDFVKSIKGEIFVENKQMIIYSFLKDLNFQLYNLKINKKFKSNAIELVLKENLNKVISLPDKDIKYSIIESIIPFLCSINRIDILEKFIDISEFINVIRTWNNTFSKTILLSLLSYKKDYKTIEELLWSIDVNNGWVSTESILYTTSNFKKDIVFIDFDIINKMYYAFINFIDSFNDKWFSRVSDLNLIKASINLLMTIEFTSDYIRQDYIKFLIRNYGLSNIFWENIDETLIKHFSEIYEAYQNYQIIKNTFANKINDFNKIFLAIRYFLLKSNYDVKPLLREFIIWNFKKQKFNKNDLKLLINLLTENDSEVIRLLVHPFSEEFSLKELIKANKISKTYNLIRQLSKIPLSLRLNTEKNLILSILENKNNLANSYSKSLLNKESKWIGLPFLTFLGIKNNEQNLLLLAITNIHEYLKTQEENIISAPVFTSIQYLYIVRNTIKTEFIRFLIDELFGLLNDKQQMELKQNLKIYRNSKIPISFRNPFFDTIVIVYTCQKNLDNRVKKIRETWLKDIQNLGIPYLIVVGGGNDEVKDDILYLNVSDDYEHLPQKSLKLYEWIYENTQFQYIYKIDDDCYFNVKEFFSKPSYKKYHYYGRIIERSVGSMDRLWHMTKSKSEYFKKSIDKSPEPTIYADGGGGYSLSRHAIYKILENLKTQRGQKLVKMSIMEDKLIGDLLSISGIRPNNEEYITYQRRKTHPNAHPVGLYENTFYPTKITPISMVHLDTDKDMHFIHKLQNTEELLPKKIFSTLYDISDIYIDQLELLSEKEKLKKLINEKIHLIATVRNEKIIIPHFLNYYRNLGIKCFLIVDNLSDDGTREFLLKQPDVVLFSTDASYKNSHYGVVWQQTLMSNFSINRWVLLADADEFLIYPNSETIGINEFIKNIEEKNYDCVRTDLLDMYPCEDLNEVDFSKKSPFEIEMYYDKPSFIPYMLSKGHFSNCDTPTLSHFRHRVISHKTLSDFTASKFALFKYTPWIRVSEGIHFINGVNNILEKSAYLLHFKYHKEFKKKVLEEVKRKQHFNNALEYKRYAIALSEVSEKLCDSKISVIYKKSKNLFKENNEEVN